MTCVYSIPEEHSGASLELLSTVLLDLIPNASPLGAATDMSVSSHVVKH